MCSCVVVASIRHGDVCDRNLFLGHTHTMSFYGFCDIFVYQALQNHNKKEGLGTRLLALVVMSYGQLKYGKVGKHQILDFYLGVYIEATFFIIKKLTM